MTSLTALGFAEHRDLHDHRVRRTRTTLAASRDNHGAHREMPPERQVRETGPVALRVAVPSTQEAQMSRVDTTTDTSTASPPVKPGEMRLEVVVLAVSDVDRAKGFYESLGWRLDADLVVDAGYRVVQLTPPGSACSIIFGTGLTSAAPGSAEGLQLSVYDIEETRADLLERGVDVSEPFHDVTGIFHHAGTKGRVTGPAAGHADYGSFVAFSDPDDNRWLLQEIKTRLPGR
jgi:catechol 2,3-dioxygenase-like lactoylglutathione lyase family enzyme